MKSTNIFLTAVLLVLLAGCNQNAAVDRGSSEQEKQGLVISGTFAFEGAVPKQLLLVRNTSAEQAGRSASISAASLSSLNGEAFEYFITVYKYVSMSFKPGDPPVISQELYEDAECSIDVENKSWSIIVGESGKYSVKIGIVKKGTAFSGEYNTEDILFAGETIPADIEISVENVSAKLNSHIIPQGWDAPIRLVPNKGFVEGRKEFSNQEELNGSTYVNLTQYQANIPKINLKFRMPKNSGIKHVTGNFYDDEGNSCAISCIESDTPAWNNFTESGDYKIATFNDTALAVQNGRYYGTLSFLDQDENLVYFCPEIINILPGLVTDFWSGDGPYTDDGEYFDLTQQMLDDYSSAYEGKSVIPAKAISGADSNKYPIVLFDNSVAEDKFSVFNTSVPANASLSDGMTLAKGYKVSNFAIAPICQNQSKSVQRIFTIENNYNLIMYPSYAGYQSGHFVASLFDQELGYYGKITSIYAAHDGYVYVLLTKYGYDQNLGHHGILDVKLKRVCVKGNPGDEGFGVVDSINFVDASNETITFRNAVHPGVSQYTDIAQDYKLASFWNYLYLCYVYNVDSDLSICCRKMYLENPQNNVISINTSYTDYELISKPISEVAPDSGLEYGTIISDLQVIPQLNSSTGEPVNTGADLYMLLAYRKDASGLSYSDEETKGGVIKLTGIADYSFSSTNAFVKIGNDTNSPYIRGCWQPENAGETISYPLTPDAEKIYFYGPTKFVARKPDELVIADEESYSYDDGNGRVLNNKDRIVTISLSTFANGNSEMGLTSVETNFDWYMETTCNGNKYMSY